MRILKSLLTFTVMIGLFCVMALLIVREILLAVGVNQVTASVKELKQIESKGQYVNECLSKGSVPVEGEDILALQLRFTSDTEYVTEVVCRQFTFDPITINTVSLSPLVKKLPGDSGIIWGDYQSGIHLSALGRQGYVYVEDREILNGYREVLGLNFETEPVASCSGYGFTCCQEGFEQGVGDQLVGATDCPKSCFSSCQERPVVLSFNSHPFFDTKTRIVQIKSNQTVTFSYVVSDTQVDSFSVKDVEKSDPFSYTILTLAESLFEKKADTAIPEEALVVVDFGDGKQEVLSELQGSVSHAYTCDKASCQYKVFARARNSLGVESADNLINSIVVSVVN